jgi:hypothetical protein
VAVPGSGGIEAMRAALHQAMDQVERFDALRRACDKLPTKPEELAELEQRLETALGQVRKAMKKGGGKGGGGGKPARPAPRPGPKKPRRKK